MRTTNVLHPWHGADHGDEAPKIVKALIITSKKGFRRADGSFIRFSKNYAILFKRKKQETNLKRKEKLEPLGTRILVPVLREFEE